MRVAAVERYRCSQVDFSTQSRLNFCGIVKILPYPPLVSGDLLRRHVTSKKALVITNDKVGPLYLAQTVKVSCC